MVCLGIYGLTRL